ncbi:hypothetical protein U3516DRAFT_759737 [Neocallimastix sp. 'constans']
MINCHTGTAKETPYRSTLRDPLGKAEPTIDNSKKKYKCTEYKTLNQCPSFIILNNENQILEYDDSHNHLENIFGAAKSIDEISQGMGLILTRSRRKQLPPDITTFDEIPNESKYYKTKRDENFMIFKNNNLIVFQSPLQAELFSKNKPIFVDGTFYIAPIFSYQVFITRTYITELNSVSNAAQKVFINVNILNTNILKKSYLINFETENWNYYDNIEHITNNESVRNDFIELWLKCLNDLNIKIPLVEMQLVEMQSPLQNDTSILMSTKDLGRTLNIYLCKKKAAV